MTRHWTLPLVAATVLGVAPAQAAAQDLRLTPAEIAAAARGGDGAGTSGVAGIQTATLYGDPTKPGLYVIEIRVPANTRIAAHRHRDDRTAVVISGTWWFGYGSVADETAVKALPPGSFYTEPANEPHFALTRAEPVVAYITGVGPTDTQFTDPTRTPKP